MRDPRFSETPLYGRILGRANFTDVLEWYIVRLLGEPKEKRYVVISHDKLRIVKGKK